MPEIPDDWCILEANIFGHDVLKRLLVLAESKENKSRNGGVRLRRQRHWRPKHSKIQILKSLTSVGKHDVYTNGKTFRTAGFTAVVLNNHKIKELNIKDGFMMLLETAWPVRGPRTRHLNTALG